MPQLLQPNMAVCNLHSIVSCMTLDIRDCFLRGDFVQDTGVIHPLQWLTYSLVRWEDLFQPCFKHSVNAAEAGMLRRLVSLFMMLSKAKADSACEDTS